MSARNDFPLPQFDNPQELRQSALKWQLLALQAQLKAIQAIATEHHINLQDLNPDGLVSRVESMIKSARDFEQCSEPSANMLEQVRTLRIICDQLKEDAEKFASSAGWRADFRMSSNLLIMAEPEQEKAAGDDPIVEDKKTLSLGANHRCLAAGHEQDSTFALQIKAICDLALEMVLVAAASRLPANKEN